MSSTIYIEVTKDPYDLMLSVGAAAYVLSPFEAKDIIKELPIRRWDRSRRRWVIPARDIPIATAKLHQHGYTIEVLGQQQPQDVKARPRRTWADDFFTALPQRLHGPAYTALSKILHPDIGGDPQMMQQLNVARDRARGAA